MKRISPRFIAGETVGAQRAFDFAEKLRALGDPDFAPLIAALDCLTDVEQSMSERAKRFAKTLGLQRKGLREPSGQSTAHEFAATYRVIELMAADPTLSKSAAFEKVAQEGLDRSGRDVAHSLPGWFNRHREAAALAYDAVTRWHLKHK